MRMSAFCILLAGIIVAASFSSCGAQSVDDNTTIIRVVVGDPVAQRPTVWLFETQLIVNTNDTDDNTTTEADGVVVGDPVAHYKGSRTKFWLPTHTLMPLLVAPDLMVFGSTFAGQRGGGEEQRFERFVIVGVEHQMLEISVNQASIASSDGSSSCQTGLARTIGVSLRPAANVPGIEYFEKNMNEYDDGSLQVRAVCFKISGSTIPAEAVQISTASQRLVIYSSPAEEYFDEAMSVQIKHVHLNFHMLEMRDTELMAGILPELWGLRALSDCVASMTKYPVALLDGECAMNGLLWTESAQNSLAI